MKKVIIVVLMMVFWLGMNAQINKQKNKEVEKLTGTWYLTPHKESGVKLLFEKENHKHYRWGNYMTILANGDLYVGYSAPCGNDTNIFRNYGKWLYNYETKEFTATIQVHKNGKRFVIEFEKKNRMKFKK